MLRITMIGSGAIGLSVLSLLKNDPDVSIDSVIVAADTLDQAREQLSRQPYPFPELKILPRRDLFAYELSDFVLEGYQHHPHIKADVAV